MKAFAIVRENDAVSLEGWGRLKDSHRRVGNDFELSSFRATEPEGVGALLEAWGVEWTYPWAKPRRDEGTGLVLTPYKTRNPAARMACFLSHFKLWTLCASRAEPMIILEDDAVWIRRFDAGVYLFDLAAAGAIGLNDPRGATRRAQDYHAAVLKHAGMLTMHVPVIDAPDVPQGLAGNSAYMISPTFAERLIAAVRTHGAWPNDAILCRQLFPLIAVTTDYFTRVSGRPSTLA